MFNIYIVSFLLFGGELRNTLIISHNKYLTATSYEQVNGLGTLRAEWIGVTFFLQRTRHLRGEIRLVPSELFYIIEINMSHDRYVNKTLCLLRRDKRCLFGWGECWVWIGLCRMLIELNLQEWFGHSRS